MNAHRFFGERCTLLCLQRGPAADPAGARRTLLRATMENLLCLALRRRRCASVLCQLESFQRFCVGHTVFSRGKACSPDI